MEQDLYFNWMSSSTYVTEMLQEFLNSNILTDVTLVSDDGIGCYAHKAVLSACSKTFQTLLKDHGQNNSVIHLIGHAYQDIESMLEYMYLGEATIRHESMDKFGRGATL